MQLTKSLVVRSQFLIWIWFHAIFGKCELVSAGPACVGARDSCAYENVFQGKPQLCNQSGKEGCLWRLRRQLLSRINFQPG